MQIVKEKNLKEIQDKLNSMNTELNKLSYIEIALKDHQFTLETKRYLLNKAAELYKIRKMHEKAAKAMTNKASLEVTQEDRINSYITAAELFAKAGKIEQADDVFIKATRETSPLQQKKIQLARKNIYIVTAKELEKHGKKASAVKFYERLMKMPIEQIEKTIIKDKLLSTYKALGMFREAKLLEAIK